MKQKEDEPQGVRVDQEITSESDNIPSAAFPLKRVIHNGNVRVYTVYFFY